MINVQYYEKKYNNLIRNYKYLFKDVRLEYQFYRHYNNTPEIKAVLEQESKINDFFLKMIQEILENYTGSVNTIDTIKLEDMKQLQSNWNKQQNNIQEVSGSILTAERRNEIIQFNLNRERIFFLTNLIFIFLIVFYVIYMGNKNKQYKTSTN